MENTEVFPEKKKSTPHSQSSKVCPKCGALNRVKATECVRCEVLFSRLEGLPLHRELKVRPAHVRAWEKVIFDYEQLWLHEEFVRSCWHDGALSFALAQYLKLLEVQPHDEIAKKMKEKILQLESVKTLTANPKDVVTLRVNVRKIWPYLSVTFSFCLIILGFAAESMRNLVGIGAAFLFLSVGLFFFFNDSVRKRF